MARNLFANTLGSQYIDPRMSLAAQLLESGTDSSPVSHWAEGLARMGKAAAGAYLQHKSMGDEAAAYKALFEGLKGTPEHMGASATSPAAQVRTGGGLDLAMQNLAGMEGNPYAGRLSRDLMMHKMALDETAKTRQADLRDAMMLAGYKANVTPRPPRTVNTAEGVYVLNDDQTLGPRLGSPAAQFVQAPPGYQPAQGGGLMPVPGGPADPAAIASQKEAELQAKAAAEKEANRPKVQSAMSDFERQVGNVVGAIDKALQQISPWSTGYGNVFFGELPGTDALDLNNTLATIRANVGFDALQRMRDNSPTGGALGQVSEMENRLLQAVQGSVDPRQSPEQLRANLMNIRRMYQELLMQKKAAFSQDYGNTSSENLTTPAAVPQNADLKKKYGLE